MVFRSQRYDRLAELFAYPEGDYSGQLNACAGALEGGYADAVAALGPLLETVAQKSLEELQELYTRTFDINPVCTLEVGWHVYGEDYARGAFLVKMREQLRRRNLPESRELPDHLTHVVALLGRIEGEEADELAARYLLPAVDKMLDGMREGDSPYRALLETVSSVVRADHDVEVVAPREPRGDPPDWANRLPVFGTRGRAER
jgi:nitrate reductase delta subunit